MDLAEEDWEGHEEGANEITPNGIFSDAALALSLEKKVTSASLLSRPRGSTPRGPSSGGSRMERPCYQLWRVARPGR